MLDECKGFNNWFNCLNCGFLSTYLCPLEGDDPIDKITHRIRMMDNQNHSGFKTDVISRYMNEQ